MCMAFGWHPFRLLGLLFVLILSVAVLLTWKDELLPDFDDERLSIVKDSIGSLSHKGSAVGQNAYQLDPPPEHPPFGAVVAAARSTENLSWMIFFQQKCALYFISDTCTACIVALCLADCVVQLDDVSLRCRQS